MARDAHWLDSKKVAFTGRLATMTRAEAAELVRRHGGQYTPSVRRDTSLLVVGQDGWPLQSDGRLTRKLRKAQHFVRLGHSIEIMSEENLLERLSLTDATCGVRGEYTVAQLARLLEVAGSRIRTWVRAGLLAPTKTVGGVDYFEFRQVSAARSLLQLLQAGATVERVRRSLKRLEAWFGPADLPLAMLTRISQSEALGVRLAQGQLADTRQQLYFDYSVQPAQPAVPLPRTESADELFESACQLEQAGRLEDAEQSYRRALVAGGPDATISFNLANLLYSQERRAEAAERFWQAVETDPSFAEAWNNLGIVLDELGQSSQAIAAFRRALDIRPQYSDAHYNLADTLDQMGHGSEALVHWRQYLEVESDGPRANFARSRSGMQQ